MAPSFAAVNSRRICIARPSAARTPHVTCAGRSQRGTRKIRGDIPDRFEPGAAPTWPCGAFFAYNRAVKLIWIIAASSGLRNLLGAELRERDYETAGFDNVRDAIESLLMRQPDAIVVELRGQPPLLIERLRSVGVPVVMVGIGPEVDAVGGAEWAAVMLRPVAVAALADRVSDLCGPD